MMLLVSGLISVQLQFPMAAYSLGLVDDHLLAADRALGFDWLTFARLFRSPEAETVLQFCYGAFRPEAFFVVIYLCARRLEAEVWRFVTAYLLGLVISVTCLTLLAASGKYVLCGVRPPEFPIQPGFATMAR